MALTRTSYGSSTIGIGVSSRTLSVTIASGVTIFIGWGYCEGSQTITSATLNGNACTLIGSRTQGTKSLYAFYYINPAAGTYNFVVNASGSTNVQALAWWGSDSATTGQPDAFNSGSNTGTSVSFDVTTVTAGSWIVGVGTNDSGGAFTRTGAFAFSDDSQWGGADIFDTDGGITPAGATTVGFTNAGSGIEILFAVAIKPADTNVTANAGVLTATISAPAPAVSGGATVSQGTPPSATFSTPAPSLTGDANIAASVVSAIFSIPTVNVITPDAYISLGALELTLSIPAPSVTGDANVSAGVQAATFSIPAPTVSIIQDVTVSVGVLTLTFSVLAPRKVGGAWRLQARVNGDADWTPQPRILG